MGHSVSSESKETYFKTITENSFKWPIRNFMWLMRDLITFISPSYTIKVYNHLFKVNMSLTREGDPTINTLKLSFTLTHQSLPTTEFHFIFSMINNSNEHIKILHLTAYPQEIFTTTIEDFIDIDFVNNNNILRNDVLEIFCEIHIDTNEVQRCHKYFENQKFSDVTILHTSGQSICAHKLTLLSYSPILATMFKYQMRHHEVIKIYDIEFDCLKEMIKFIYTGKLENLESCTPRLLAAAEKYEIQNLKKFCENHLLKNLNKDSVIEILEKADENGSTDLKAKILDYISENLKDINKESLKSIKNKNLLVDLIRAMASKKKT